MDSSVYTPIEGEGRSGRFDASRGKPEIQAQLKSGAPWVTLTQLDTYLNTTATDAQRTHGGEAFTVKLHSKAMVYGIRIIAVRRAVTILPKTSHRAPI